MSDYEIPNNDVVSSEDIHPEIDLSEEDLSNANLSEANLRHANLSEANLRHANLSNADLFKADLSKADLFDVDLSKSNLLKADLSEADLFNANLSEANLITADLSKTILAETTLTGVNLSRKTSIDPPGEQIAPYLLNISNDVSKEERYDTIARANHELREAYSANGLVSQARTVRVWERRARRREALAEESWQGTFDWAASLLSRVVTGYGVKLLPVVVIMSLLYLCSAFIYWQWGGMSWTYSLYYSVVTFTTSPPKSPPSGLLSIVAGIETFAGTAAIVFLGYVLGTRERV